MRFDEYTIRLLKPEDAESYYQLIQNNLSRLEDTFAGTVVKNQSIEMTKVFIKESLEMNADKVYFPFVICVLNSEKLVGFIDLKNVNWDIPKTEIGYFIDLNFEGKGIASNALKKIINYCFDELKMDKLSLRTLKENIGSQKVAEKNGFEREGFIKKDYKTMSGEVVDLVYYGLIRT